MKILLVTTKAAPGGVQTFLAVLARFLSKHGHEVMVAAGAGDYLPAQLSSSPVVFYRLKSFSGKLSLRSLVSYVLELRSILKDWPADVIHFNSSHALIGLLGLRGSRKYKTIFTVHGLSFIDKGYGSNWSRPFYYFLYRYLFSRANRLVFVSQNNLTEAMKQKIVSGGELIYNGLDLNKSSIWSKDEARISLSSLVGRDLSSCLLVGSVGRLCYQKNYNFLIRQWPRLLAVYPGAKLVIIGEGEERKTLQKIISNLYLSDSVFIVLAAPAVPYLPAFDLFVLSSRYEGLPISIIEAVAAGLPILASRVGGNSEILRHQDELYEAGNAEDFFSKASGLLSDAALRQAVINTNHLALKDFGSEEMGQRYLEIYS